MRFELDGTQYRFWFRYDKKKKTREIPVKENFSVWHSNNQQAHYGAPNQKVTLIVDETRYSTTCSLGVPDESQPTGLRLVATATANCSLQDQYVRNTGRDKALQKLLKVLTATGAEERRIAAALAQSWYKRSAKVRRGEHAGNGPI